MRRRIAIIIGVLALGLPVTACGTGDDASREDAHDVRGNLVDKTRPHVVTFNNKYANVVTKCLGAPDKSVDGAPQGERDPKDTATTGGGWRIVLTSGSHADNMILVQDPACPGYVEGTDPQQRIAAKQGHK